MSKSAGNYKRAAGMGKPLPETYERDHFPDLVSQLKRLERDLREAIIEKFPIGCEVVPTHPADTWAAGVVVNHSARRGVRIKTLWTDRRGNVSQGVLIRHYTLVDRAS